MKKGLLYTIGISALVLAGTTFCRKEPARQPQEQPVFQQPTPVQQTPREYTIKRGDYLSGIVHREMELRGIAIYNKVREIQALNDFGPERDTYVVVDGELVRGQDGFVDLIYPGERIKY